MPRAEALYRSAYNGLYHERSLTVALDVLRAALLGVTVLVLSGHALGAGVVWNQKGTAWEDPANWSTGRTPGPDDIAVFPALNEAVKNQPVVRGTVHIGGIRFDNGT